MNIYMINVFIKMIIIRQPQLKKLCSTYSVCYTVNKYTNTLIKLNKVIFKYINSNFHTALLRFYFSFSIKKQASKIISIFKRVFSRPSSTCLLISYEHFVWIYPYSCCFYQIPILHKQNQHFSQLDCKLFKCLTMVFCIFYVSFKLLININ